MECNALIFGRMKTKWRIFHPGKVKLSKKVVFCRWNSVILQTDRTMKYLHTLLLFSLPLLGIAQATTTVEPDERLHDVFDVAYLEALQTNNPLLLQRWNYYLDHAWYLADYPEGKGKLDFPVVRIADLEKINILHLEKEQHLQRDWRKRMKYRIEGTKKILIYYSGKEFTEDLNKHLGR